MEQQQYEHNAFTQFKLINQRLDQLCHRHNLLHEENVDCMETWYPGMSLQKHEMPWSSMPYLGTKFLCNQRFLHGYFVSSILLNQYKRLCLASDIGCFGDSALAEVFKLYKDVVAYSATDSCNDAITEEKEKYEKGYEGIMHDMVQGKIHTIQILYV